MALLNFNGEGVEEQDDYKPVPAGDYIAQIVKSEMAPTKAGTGELLKLQFKIIEGEKDYVGRIIFVSLNWKNPNKQAEEISKRALKSICVACGFPNGVGDSEDLHDKPIKITVAIKKGNADYPDPTNIIKGYHAYGNTGKDKTPDFVKGESNVAEADAVEDAVTTGDPAKAMWDD